MFPEGGRIWTARPVLSLHNSGQASLTATDESIPVATLADVDPQTWLDALAPMSTLPVWIQAALVAVVLAAFVFVIVAVFKHLWRLLTRGSFAREKSQ